MLEFLDLKDEYSETDLEDALIKHLETFFLKLGGDFCFIGQRRVIGDGRMPTMRIIPPFNIGEDSQPRFLVRGEEAFAHRVVIAIAHSSIEGRTPASRQSFPNRNTTTLPE